MTTALPSFRLSPVHHLRLNSIRLNLDIAGVTLVRLFVPFVHEPTLLTLLNIYNVLAWTTILRLDSGRIPEFGTTRILQRNAWVFTLKVLPFVVVAFGILARVLHIPLYPRPFAIAGSVSMVFAAYMDELLFRNTLQPKFRKLGIPTMAAILLQSILYASSFAIGHETLGITLSALLLGVVNGWIVYKFRSLWPVFVLGLLWRIVFL